MPETTARSSNQSTLRGTDAPPMSARPVRASSTDETRARLHRVAMELIRSRNRQLLTEFLTLRRVVA